MPRNFYDRKLTPRHRMKLTNLFKSLRHRRIRKDVSLKSPTHTRSSSPPIPIANDFVSEQPLSSDLSTTSLRLSSYRSDVSSIQSITEKERSSGMSAPRPSLWALSNLQRGHVLSSRSVPNLPTSPSIFQLRSASTKDYLVDRLEQYLGQLHLGDASPDRGDVSLLDISPRDIPMDVSPQRPAEPEPPRPASAKENEIPRASPSVPMILITSVNAKQGKPPPPSVHRRTPLGPSNTGPTKPTLHDDPFVAYGTSQFPGSIAFHLPSALARSRPYAPETPTPMHCHHVGECSGGLWEMFHPPLVAGRFTLPPFRLPPLSTSLFDVP